MIWSARLGQIKNQLNDLQTYFRIQLQLDSRDMWKHNGVDQIILNTNTHTHHAHLLMSKISMTALVVSQSFATVILYLLQIQYHSV